MMTLAVNRRRNMELKTLKPTGGTNVAKTELRAGHIDNKRPAPYEQTESLQRVGEGVPTRSREMIKSLYHRESQHLRGKVGCEAKYPCMDRDGTYSSVACSTKAPPTRPMYVRLLQPESWAHT